MPWHACPCMAKTRGQRQCRMHFLPPPVQSPFNHRLLSWQLHGTVREATEPG